MAEEKTLRERWIAALRSGEYEQGKGALCEAGKFCCLGVLADLVGVEWEEQEDLESDDPSKDELVFAFGGTEYSYYLPKGALPGDWDAQLIRRNDGWGIGFPDAINPHTFAEIADYIEAHPEIDPKWPPEAT